MDERIIISCSTCTSQKHIYIYVTGKDLCRAMHSVCTEGKIQCIRPHIITPGVLSTARYSIVYAGEDCRCAMMSNCYRSVQNMSSSVLLLVYQLVLC